MRHAAIKIIGSPRGKLSGDLRRVTDDEPLRVRERVAVAGLLAPVGPRPNPDRPATTWPVHGVEPAKATSSQA